MVRTPLVVGNWKMYKTSAAARDFISVLRKESIPADRKVFLAVPFPAIESAIDAAKGSAISIGAQNMHDQEEGAFTGEVSGRMLKSSGAAFVLLGHSERRQHFAETNDFIHRKLVRALEEGLMPILCIGEFLEERESVLKLQLEEGLQKISSEQAAEIAIAYEPVWAIGTGKTATPELAQSVHHFIRSWLNERFGRECAQKISLLYGGSVKPDNIGSLMQQPDIDGVLVGGASLDVKSFVQIVNY